MHDETPSSQNAGKDQAINDLLPLVYHELRKMAARKLARERSSLTLDATGLVHEAYLRLLGPGGNGAREPWNHRGHFYGAAAEAMRRILIERARGKATA